MNISGRSFAYPVLCAGGSDYRTSKFTVDYLTSMNGVNSIGLVFDIKPDCPEIERMIADGTAEYIIHLECPTTAFREIVRSNSGHIEYSVSIHRLVGTLEAVALVVLKKDITDFYCGDWDSDYDGMTFELSAGSVLAYQNLDKLRIKSGHASFTDADSIFTVYKKLTDSDEPADVSVDGRGIRIGLSSGDYGMFTALSADDRMRPVLNGTLILPALVWLFEELRQDGGRERYRDSDWYIALTESYAKRGISFENEVFLSEKTSFQLAQEAMELPVTKALGQLPLIMNPAEDEE